MQSTSDLDVLLRIYSALLVRNVAFTILPLRPSSAGKWGAFGRPFSFPERLQLTNSPVIPGLVPGSTSVMKEQPWMAGQARP